jgi:hypothetical protein
VNEYNILSGKEYFDPTRLEHTNILLTGSICGIKLPTIEFFFVSGVEVPGAKPIRVRNLPVVNMVIWGVGPTVGYDHVAPVGLTY